MLALHEGVRKMSCAYVKGLSLRCLHFYWHDVTVCFVNILRFLWFSVQLGVRKMIVLVMIYLKYFYKPFQHELV
jgi:hypothetical protein